MPVDGRKDTIALDAAFPFRIDEVRLRVDDGTGDFFHWHEYFEVLLILSGTGCYYVNGQAFEVTGGDILIFNNAELHGWQVTQSEMRVLAMVFAPRLVAGYGDFSDVAYLKPFIERGENFKNRVGGWEPCAAQIADIMREIAGEWEQKRDGHRLMIKADVLRLLTMLVRHYHDDSRSAARADRNKALLRLKRAFEYIDGGYCGKLTLKEAANRVYMSPNYFSHYFHAATGVSFSDYVTMRRVHKARELLETTNRSTYEIAVECGFHNSSNFYRLYRKHTGQSPRKHLPEVENPHNSTEGS